jgi:hypothetical protein
MSRDPKYSKLRAKFCGEFVNYVLVGTVVIKVLGFGKVLTLYVLLYAGAFVLFEVCVWSVNRWYDRKERRTRRWINGQGG